MHLCILGSSSTLNPLSLTLGAVTLPLLQVSQVRKLSGSVRFKFVQFTHLQPVGFKLTESLKTKESKHTHKNARRRSTRKASGGEKVMAEEPPLRLHRQAGNHQSPSLALHYPRSTQHRLGRRPLPDHSQLHRRLPFYPPYLQVPSQFLPP